MMFSGEIKCPDCGCPLDSEARTCNYCYSSAPSTAAWQPHKMSPGMWLVFGLVVTTIVVGWYCFGVDWYELVSSRN